MNHSRPILNPSIMPFLSNWARYTLLRSAYLLASDEVKHPRLVVASKSLVATVISLSTSLISSVFRNYNTNYNTLSPLTINIDIRYDYYTALKLMMIMFYDTDYHS